MEERQRGFERFARRAEGRLSTGGGLLLLMDPFTQDGRGGMVVEERARPMTGPVIRFVVCRSRDRRMMMMMRGGKRRKRRGSIGA
jgi:hypothetical protein